MMTTEPKRIVSIEAKAVERIVAPDCEDALWSAYLIGLCILSMII